MKKKTLLGVAAAAAVGAAGWYLAAGGRKNQIEHIRREAKRLLAVRRGTHPCRINQSHQIAKSGKRQHSGSAGQREKQTGSQQMARQSSRPLNLVAGHPFVSRHMPGRQKQASEQQQA